MLTLGELSKKLDRLRMLEMMEKLTSGPNSKQKMNPDAIKEITELRNLRIMTFDLTEKPCTK